MLNSDCIVLLLLQLLLLFFKFLLYVVLVLPELILPLLDCIGWIIGRIVILIGVTGMPSFLSDFSIATLLEAHAYVNASVIESCFTSWIEKTRVFVSGELSTGSHCENCFHVTYFVGTIEGIPITLGFNNCLVSYLGESKAAVFKPEKVGNIGFLVYKFGEVYKFYDNLFWAAVVLIWAVSF